MRNPRSGLSNVWLILIMISLLVDSATSTTVLAQQTSAIVIGTKHVLLCQNSSIFTSNTSMVFESPPKEGWIFDHMEVEFECQFGVAGSNVSTIFSIDNGYIKEYGNMTGSYTVFFLGNASRVEIKNISPLDIHVRLKAKAFYSRILSAPMKLSGSTQEIQFTVPQDSSQEDEYAIYWKGSCNLKSLTTPKGKDILKQTTKQKVLGYFKWGFVYMSFNPINLTKQYKLKENGIGLWKIKMSVVDPSVPSLYLADGFQVSLHYQNVTLFNTFSLKKGGNVPVDLIREEFLLETWNASESVIITATYYKGYINVDGALLYNGSVELDSEGKKLYIDEWICYRSSMSIKNVGYATIPVSVGFVLSFIKYVDHEDVGQGLNFTLDPSTSAPKPLPSCSSWQLGLDITSTKRLSSPALLVPNGSRAEDLSPLIQHDQYKIGLGKTYYVDFSTLNIVYGVYKTSFNPVYAWKMLGNGTYGTWQLNATSDN